MTKPVYRQIYLNTRAYAYSALSEQVHRLARGPVYAAVRRPIYARVNQQIFSQIYWHLSDRSGTT